MTDATPDPTQDDASEPSPIRLLLVDDHTVVRQGLRMVLSLEDDFEVVGEAGNGQEAVEQVPLTNPHVVLMDLQMPVMNGVEASATTQEGTR